MRISDWSSDVCSSDLLRRPSLHRRIVLKLSPMGHVSTRTAGNRDQQRGALPGAGIGDVILRRRLRASSRSPGASVRGLARRQIVTGHAGIAGAFAVADEYGLHRSEEHTSELQSLMRNSYAVIWL